MCGARQLWFAMLLHATTRHHSVDDKYHPIFHYNMHIKRLLHYRPEWYCWALLGAMSRTAVLLGRFFVSPWKTKKNKARAFALALLIISSKHLRKTCSIASIHTSDRWSVWYVWSIPTWWSRSYRADVFLICMICMICMISLMLPGGSRIVRAI